METTHLLNLSVQVALLKLHLRELQSQKFSFGSMLLKLLRTMHRSLSPDGHYCTHIVTVYYISIPPLSQNPLSTPVIPTTPATNH